MPKVPTAKKGKESAKSKPRPSRKLRTPTASLDDSTPNANPQPLSSATPNGNLAASRKRKVSIDSKGSPAEKRPKIAAKLKEAVAEPIRGHIRPPVEFRNIEWNPDAQRDQVDALAPEDTDDTIARQANILLAAIQDTPNDAVDEEVIGNEQEDPDEAVDDYEHDIDAETPISEMTKRGCEQMWEGYVTGNDKPNNKISNEERAYASELLATHLIQGETEGGWQHFKSLGVKLGKQKKSGKDGNKINSNDPEKARRTAQRKHTRLRSALEQHPLYFKACQNLSYIPKGQHQTLETLLHQCKDEIEARIESEYQNFLEANVPGYNRNDTTQQIKLFTHKSKQRAGPISATQTELGKTAAVRQEINFLNVDLEEVTGDQEGTVGLMRLVKCRLEIHRMHYDRVRKERVGKVRKGDLEEEHGIATYSHFERLVKELGRGIEGLEGVRDVVREEGDDEGEADAEEGDGDGDDADKDGVEGESESEVERSEEASED